MKRKLKIRWLVYVLVILSLSTGVTVSRYLTNITGEAKADVADFAMSGEFGIGSVSLDISNLVPGDTKNIVFSVVNYSGSGSSKQVSDVAQNYTIWLESTGNLPITYTLTANDPALDPSRGSTAVPWDAGWQPGTETKRIETKSDGRLPHTEAVEHLYTLTAVWPENQNQTRYSFEVDAVILHVESRQVDLN